MTGGSTGVSGEKVIGSNFSSLSSFGSLDFLLSFNFGAGTAPPAVWLNRAEMDESVTAIVWVMVPGFIAKAARWAIGDRSAV